MIVNKKIIEAFREISEQNIKYMNTPDKDRKYLVRLLDIFKKNLTEQEQVFIFKVILEQIHYRNIITDPDNIIQIHNVKLKTITYVFILTVSVVLLTAVLFKVNESLNGVVETFGHILKLLSL